MRPIPPTVACTMLLLGLTATDSLADPALVADLDSNATNGPDTLEGEPGDTVLVRIWTTGSTDSLFGFGITVGDTSGVLAWVEDTASAIFALPEEWTRFTVLRDERGFLLLQPYDFSFSQPLHLPAEVARLRVVATDSALTSIRQKPACLGAQKAHTKAVPRAFRRRFVAGSRIAS